jgi:xanthine dehydrogenase accessory factor
MSLDIPQIQAAIAAHGTITRILIARSAGSAPRNAGTSMLVWIGGQQGTIGGGALEHMAMQEALAMPPGSPLLSRTIPLGPDLGQCCGGSVTLVWERFDRSHSPSYARSLTTGTGPSTRLLSLPPGSAPRIHDGWLIEAPPLPRRAVWIYGAGHVGQALVGALAPLPDISITWVDTDANRFPVQTCDLSQLVATNPEQVVKYAPPDADHLILTYSHAMDLALCHALLHQPTGSIGLIGSATKWARFRSRLAALGHSPAQIARIGCPIGDPALGKHPQAIALGVATALLRTTGMKAGVRAG